MADKSIKHTFENPVTSEKHINWAKVLVILVGILGFLVIGIYIGRIYFSEDIVQVKTTSQNKQANETKTSTTTVSDEVANTSVSIPEEILNNKYGFPSGGPGDVDLSIEYGARWAGPYTGSFVWGDMQNSIDFSTTDRYIKGYGEAEVGTLVTLWPFADWDQETHTNSEACKVNINDIFINPGEKFDNKDEKKMKKDMMFEKEGKDLGFKKEGKEGQG